jgi:hypothetical protein
MTTNHVSGNGYLDVKRRCEFDMYKLQAFGLTNKNISMELTLLYRLL